MELLSMNRVLTAEQAAEVLQLRPETVRRLLNKGELPGRKVGRKWRIPEQALLEFLGGEGELSGRIDEPEWIPQS
jgi:excisionase family DNA binding protein